MARTRIVGALFAALTLTACGATGHARSTVAGGWPSRHPVCLRASVAAMAHLLAVPVGTISHSISTGSNSAPQCAYRVRLRGRRAVEVLTNDQVVQAAYFVVERTIDEDAQYWGVGPRPNAPPVAVNLGLESSWFPDEQWLISTDGYRIITASVEWAGASRRQKIGLARAVTASYLHTPRGKRAARVARDYP
jgi:hypothetical protein